jgi:light-regulated signal transduction histidine kinase (bacteriophytochrome)
MLVMAVIRDVSARTKAEGDLKRAYDELTLQVMERTATLSITNEELLAEIEERKRTETQLEEYKRNLEEQVTERTAELTAVNKELEAFSYSVSHDLRAPIRQMSGFVELLQKQVADHPNKKIHQYLTLMTTASKKMDGLINDLLALSYVGRKEMQKGKVKLNALVKEVVGEIQYELKERKINWEIDALPDVIGDRALLRLVLVNLLSNAAKFSSTRKEAKIKITCKDEDGKFTCSVKDNGVGFDMKYVDRLFGVFQRLHTQEEFEGTGIGLANVQRIITRHGGRVWAEGALGQGATFFFTLPKTKEK